MAAYSKINLFLKVVRKRPDGYHDLQSVMQSLALHDTLTISAGPMDGPGGGFQLTCSDPSLPTCDRNLVTRAAKFMMREYGITQPVSIRLEKRIPVAAGLAGGSSDCAATLLGFNRLFDLNIPVHNPGGASLMGIGQNFGADVPFCLMGGGATASGTALAEGIGERLTPLPAHPDVWVVLACPDIPVSTADIFGRYVVRSQGQSGCSKLTAMLEALSQGDVHKIAANFYNDLTHITANLHREVRHLIEEMKRQGAIAAAMSGSGPSVFGYFTQEETAQRAQERLQHIAGRAILTRTIKKGAGAPGPKAGRTLRVLLAQATWEA